MARRRARGEGTVFQRNDGRWVGEVTTGYDQETGQQVKKCVYGRSEKEAVEKRDTLLHQVRQGVTPIPERLTVSEFLARWLAESKRPKLKETTFASYEQVVRLYVKPYVGHLKLAKLQPVDVQRMLNRLLESGPSARTVQYAHTLLKQALGQAQKWGMLTRNVAELVDGVRVVQPEIHPFTVEQARQLLAHTKGHRHEGLITIALAMGLRQGEALALRWSDVDFGRRILRVRHTLQRLGRTWKLTEPKSRNSRRELLIPSVVLLALYGQRKLVDDARTIAGSAWQEHEFVFPSSLGTPLDKNNVRHAFQSLLTDARLPMRRFHDLRHTCGTLLKAQGVPDRTIMSILGHSQLSMTMRYVHVLDSMQSEAVAAIDGVLSSRPGSRKSKAVVRAS